jgi:hypothetical protein
VYFVLFVFLVLPISVQRSAVQQQAWQVERSRVEHSALAFAHPTA